MLSDCNSCSFGNDTLIVHSRLQTFCSIRQRGWRLFGVATVCRFLPQRSQVSE